MADWPAQAIDEVMLAVAAAGVAFTVIEPLLTVGTAIQAAFEVISTVITSAATKLLDV